MFLLNSDRVSAEYHMHLTAVGSVLHVDCRIVVETVDETSPGSDSSTVNALDIAKRQNAI